MITKDTQVEEIMDIDGVLSYFLQNGVSPISCSGAFPQSLGNLLRIKKVADPDAFIRGLNAFVSGLTEKTDGH